MDMFFMHLLPLYAFTVHFIFLLVDLKIVHRIRKGFWAADPLDKSENVILLNLLVSYPLLRCAQFYVRRT
jgi:hypothetical protein